MKLIDLLVASSRDENMPERIKVFDEVFKLEKGVVLTTYKQEETGDYLFSDEYDWEGSLNNEVEVLSGELEFNTLDEDDVYTSLNCSTWHLDQMDELVDNFTRQEIAIKKLIRGQKKIIERLEKIEE